MRTHFASIVGVTCLLVAIAACSAEPPRVERAPAKLQPYVRPQGVALQINAEQALASGSVRSLPERDRVRQIKRELAAEANGDTATTFFTPGGAPLPVYLNFEQQTYQGGADNAANKVSSVIGSGSATIGAYRGTEQQRQAIVSCVQEQFARFNVTVTDVEPTGEFTECHIGGTPGQAGMPQGVGGVAPIDQFSCGIIPRAVVYVFSDALGNGSQINCEVAAQEIAHAFSLDHEFLCQDPMTYLNGCGAKSFQDIDAQCGEFEPRQCGCTGNTQNSVERMLEVLGDGVPLDPDDVTPPTAQLTGPDDEASFQSSAQGTQLTVTGTATDDGTIVGMDLLWDRAGVPTDVFTCPGNFNGGGVTCTRNGNTATWVILVGLGDRTFRMRVRDGGGNETVTPERTIHLTEDGSPPPPPPDDDIAPVVTVSTPANNQELLANSTIEIVANASDNLGLASVELMWNFPQPTTFQCPISQQAISCVVEGDTHTWSLTVGSGVRAFQVRAVDIAGNTTVTPERTINLTTDPAEPPPDTGSDNDTIAEPNNDANSAFATRCGTAIDVIAAPGDEDWFVVEAPEGTNVQVGLTVAGGAALALALTDATGESTLAETANVVSGEALTVASPGPAVLARVTTSGAASVPYRVAVTCGDDQVVPPPPGEDDDLEPNNGTDDASRSFCGQERSALAALDDDFYVFAVRDNDTVSVAVGGDAKATLLAADGATVLAGPGADISAPGVTAGDVFVKIEPNDPAVGATYDVSFTCAAGIGDPNTGGTCACSARETNGSAIALALFALVLHLRRAAFVRRRST